MKSFEKGKPLGLLPVISHAFSKPDKLEHILDNAAKDFGEKIITGIIKIKNNLFGIFNIKHFLAALFLPTEFFKFRKDWRPAFPRAIPGD